MTPYTPAAIAKIKQCALHLPASKIADDLGWDLATLRDRARRHGIELLAPTSMIEPERPPVIRRPDAAPKLPPDHVPRVTADMTLEQIKSVLGPRQAQILEALEGTLRTRQAMRAIQIEQYCEMACTVSNICQIVRRIDQHLSVTKWRVEFARFQRGGYRLVVRE